MRPRCWAASLPGGFVRATDRWRVEHGLRPPGLATWTMEPSAPVAVGDLDATRRFDDVERAPFPTQSPATRSSGCKSKPLPTRRARPNRRSAHPNSHRTASHYVRPLEKPGCPDRGAGVTFWTCVEVNPSPTMLRSFYEVMISIQRFPTRPPRRIRSSTVSSASQCSSRSL